jgi:hypothetical protein
MSRAATFPSALLALGACAVLGLGVARAGEEAPNAKGKKVRIGTYDSRAIAIAYAHSGFNPVKEKWAAYEKAKAASDRAKMKELEAWGEQHQRQLHFQGFGRVPVDDLLAPVKDKMAKLAREQRLAAITMGCDFTGGDVELVDVTDALVRLYEPSEKTLALVRGIRGAKPVPLPQLAAMPAKH